MRQPGVLDISQPVHVLLHPLCLYIGARTPAMSAAAVAAATFTDSAAAVAEPTRTQGQQVQ